MTTEKLQLEFHPGNGAMTPRGERYMPSGLICVPGLVWTKTFGCT